MITLHTSDRREDVPTLAPYLRRSLDLGMVMDPAEMRPVDIHTCRWIGYGIGKGVTDPTQHATIFAIPTKLQQGLHAELIDGFPDVDPFPLCYDDRAHVRGFGGFVRWVYFADPRGGPGVFGLDWSIAARPTSGVAESMTRAATTITTVAAHGVPLDAEVALLNWHMCEDPLITNFRARMQLRTIADWNARAPQYFHRGSGYCPRCGLRTLAHRERFCARCGCDPNRFWVPCKGGAQCRGECSPVHRNITRTPRRTNHHDP